MEPVAESHLSRVSPGQILARVFSDPDFRRRFFTERDKTLAGYELSAEECAALKQITRNDLYAALGGTIAHRLLPLRASRRFVVIPVGLQIKGELQPSLEPGDIPLFLDQEKSNAAIMQDGRPANLDGSPISPAAPNAFGAGLHPTTRMCLGALEDHLEPGQTVIDLGTGTGVLAIAAAKLGASSVLALDNDPVAIQVACQQVALNGVDEIVRLELGSLGKSPKKAVDATISGGIQIPLFQASADLLVANLTRPVHLRMIQSGGYSTAMRPGGCLALSGFCTDDILSLRDALEENGFVLIVEKIIGSWAALIARFIANSHTPG